MPQSNRYLSFAIAALLLATATGWVGVRWSEAPLLKTIFDNLHWTAGYACGAVLAWKAYRALGEEDRDIARWAWIGLSILTIGQLVWDVQVSQEWLPFPGPSDAFFIATGLLISVGLLRASLSHLDQSARSALFLDVCTMAIGVLCLCLVLYLPKQGTYSVFQLTVMLLYPVSLIVPMTLAIMLVLTLQVRMNWRVLALPVFLGLFAACWTRWNLLFLEDKLSDGSWLNLSFSAVAIGLGWAITQFDLKRTASGAWARQSDNIVRFLPMVMVGLAAVGAIAANQNEAYSDNIQILALAGAMLVIGLAMVRQSYLLRDRDLLLAAQRVVGERERELETLNRELERRVEIRTKELLQSQKMAALGAIVAGVSHELNTPIGNVRLVASTLHEEVALLKSHIESGQLKKSELIALLDRTTNASDMIEQGLIRAADLISSFKQIAVDRTAERHRNFKLKQLVGEIVRVQQVTLRNRSVAINVNIADSIELDSFPGPLGQLLDILIENAHFHGIDVNASGEINIEAEVVAGAKVRIAISDNGKGIDPATIDKIFEPFFTTKLGKGGSGLGLHVAWNIATDLLNGSITVTSTPGAGTRFSIEIPLVSR